MRKPPLVPGWPILGNAIAMAKQPAMFWVSAAAEHGPVFRVRYPTAPNGEMTVLAGLEANRFASLHGHEVFTTKEYYHHLTREVGTPNYICALDGDPHRYFRGVMKASLSREAMAPHLGEMLDVVEATAMSWPVGTRLPVMPAITRLTLEQLSVAAAGCPIDDATYATLRTYAKTFVGSGVAGQPALWFKWPPYQRAKRRLDDFLDEQLAEHAADPPRGQRKPDLFDAVRAAVYPDGTPFDAADQRANAHLPYANGFIYGGRICSYMLYALLRHPAILERVLAETDSAYAHGQPTMVELGRMTTLHNCIKETYRRYPIAPAVPRWAARTFEHEGYTIEEGSAVFVAIVVPHFDERYFHDPYTFDPDRFSPPRSEARRPYAFSPYGLGRHICLSIGMVETVVMTTMIGLLRNLEMAIDPPDYEMRSVLDPVPGPHESFSVSVNAHRDAPASVDPLPGHDSDVVAALMGLHLSDGELRRIVEGVKRQTFAAGDTIVREGDEADAFYVIVDGEVDVLHESAGTPVKLTTLGARQYFGEIGLLHGVRRTATVRAASDRARVLVIERELFTHIVGEHDLTSSEIAAMARRRMAALDLAAALPQLTSEQIGSFGAALRWRSYDPGARVVEQGAEADRFFIIHAGRAEVVNEHHSGDPIHLAWLGAGEYFGEIGILRRAPRSATVRVPEDGTALEVLEMDRDDFLRLVEGPGSAATGEAVAHEITRRLLQLGAQANP